MARKGQFVGSVSLSLRGPKRGVIELAFLAVLYVGCSSSRLLASNDFQAARDRAVEILNFEKAWRIAVENSLNDFFARDDLIGLFGSFGMRRLTTWSLPRC